MRGRRGRTALCAVALGVLLAASPAPAATRAGWAHVPLDSLRPVGGLRRDGERTFQLLAPLWPSTHLSWHRLDADDPGGRAPAMGMRGPGRVDSGRVVWNPAESRRRIWAVGVPVDWVEVRGDSFVMDSVIYWRRVAERGRGGAAAFRQIAGLALGDGDTLAADSILSSPALARSVWAWPVVRQRAELSLARGDTARADSLLESADRTGWPEAERAAWLALRVRLRTDLRDTTRAVEFARQALRVYPSLPATGRALTLLEALLRARDAALTPDEERAAAEVEVFAGRSREAAARLRRVIADPGAGDGRWRAGLRLCELMRGARRFTEARVTSDSLSRAPGWESVRDRLWLEKARAELGARRPESALAIYSRLAERDSLMPAVAWEAGRAAEDAGWWEDAVRWYRRVPPGAARAGGTRASGPGSCSSPSGGLTRRSPAGHPTLRTAHASGAALTWRFLGGSVAGDSLLRLVAAQPGYSFYRAAARDTLGARGWPGGIVGGACGEDSRCGPLREARDLADLGLTADAAQLLSRWAAGDARLRPRSGEPLALEWLYAAEQAYAIGRIGFGIFLSERAREQDASLELRQQWQVVPWAYPPAFESLFVAPRDTVVGSLEPALLFALTRQESVFDPRARSRSDALGLMQLKLGTAADMAKLARDPAPSEATLLDPERNVRYGARYLARLLRRFDGSVAAALCAYNAGAGSLSTRWRELRARGGEALLCELASNPLAQDYAKRILGFRQAYRELRPTAAAP